MTHVELRALRGRNPLGLFAALGALDVATRLLPDRDVRLRWTDGLEPYAIVSGPDSLDHLVQLCGQDRVRWATSPVLTWGPGGGPLTDLKPSMTDLRDWILAVSDAYRISRDPVDVRLLAGLVAEGAAAGKNDAKPTHFHFTAGQQQFLIMVRELQARSEPDHFVEALAGPWRSASTLPVLGWDAARGDRIAAYQGPKPGGEKKTGVPGADWLGFLGLSYFPVVLTVDRWGQRRLGTTGCSGTWKSGTFRWPLWSVPLSSEVVRSVLVDGRLATLDDCDRRRLGVSGMWQAAIRRADQGGYGSFGPPGPAVVGSTARSTGGKNWPHP